jgi:hypothetical protein
MRLVLSQEKKKELLGLLGKKPDIVLSNMFGLTRQRISQLRKLRGIKPWNAEFKISMVIPTGYSKPDMANMKKAMDQIGEKNRSRYIRCAVRQRNKSILTGQ